MHLLPVQADLAVRLAAEGGNAGGVCAQPGRPVDVWVVEEAVAVICSAPQQAAQCLISRTGMSALHSSLHLQPGRCGRQRRAHLCRCHPRQ